MQSQLVIKSPFKNLVMAKLPSAFPAPFLYFLLTLMPILVISLPPTDQTQTILLTIKQQWGNPPQLSSWNTSSPPCSWPGITCSGGAVTGLNLTNYNITKPIPPSICNLKNLTMLDLSHNYFPGNFPTSLYNCSNLNYLDLSQNYFVGPIPSDIDRLSSSLLHIDVGANSFSSNIPSTISRLSELRFLNLNRNKFNGSFPSEIGNLSSLEYLDLSFNNLDGPIPKGLFQLKTLSEVFLGDNRLSGGIPTPIESLNLNLIVLRNNSLGGSIPEDFGKLTRLGFLDLSFNGLEGPIPKVLFQLKKLGGVSLSDNRLSGGIPTPIELLSLTFMDLSNNDLSGSIPEDFRKLKQLVYLYLGSNLLQGPLPIPPPSLQYLLIPNNSLSGEISPLVCHARSLNFTNGSLPLAVPKPNQLRTLDLSGNQFEGALPRSLADCTSLEVLHVGNNKIKDTFPYWLETLLELQVLIIRSNRFHGPIKFLESKFSFSKLRIIDLSYNEFTGHLPVSYFEHFQAMKNKTMPGKKYMGEGYFFDCLEVTMKGIQLEMLRISTMFTAIDFSSNNFRGEIPNVVGSLISLHVLNLSHNSLTGHIPSLFGDMKSLESLDISSNRLTGRIPTELTSLTFLEVLNLSWNHLQGPIPHGPQFDTFENVSYVGNPGLCGFPLSKGCGDNNPTKVKPPVLQEEEPDSDFGVLLLKFMAMGYGCGMAVGLFLGSLMFLIGRPKFFVRLAEREIPKKVIRLRKLITDTVTRRNK